MSSAVVLDKLKKGLKSPFFDNKPENQKEILSKLKWENTDPLSEMMIEYMIDFG